jgi:SPP1 family phage portal protein
VSIIFDIDANREILTKVFSDFQRQYHINFHMWLYYNGITDVGHAYDISASGTYEDIFVNEFALNAQGVGEYSYINDRNNNKIPTNFIGKFVDEETSYSIGQNLNYISYSGDSKIIEAIRLNLANWKEDHDVKLMKDMLTYSKTFELYYIDKDACFCSRIISPRHGIAYTDECDEPIFFLHIFRRAYDTKQYVDVYTDSEIIHCNEVFNELGRQSHPFGCVPVGIANLSEDGWLGTLYHKCKGLQDAYERNLSDVSQEIGEFRNSYLILNNLAIQDDDIEDMKKKGIIETKGKDGSATWLEKNVNDAFLQNTLRTIEDKLYQISCHLNHNDKISSNVSSLAIRAKLISLEEKCRLNEKALTNTIKTRLRILFAYLKYLKSSNNYDVRDVKVKWTANIPSDDLTNSTIVTALGDKLSTETALSLFSFIDNPANEVKKAKAETKANSIGAALLNPPVMPNAPVMGGGMNGSKQGIPQ